MKGIFITLEGPDGSGKSSQVGYLMGLFEKAGFKVRLTREPGGTELAEKIRRLLLEDPKLPMTEMLLFAAARYEHTQKVILPAIEAGEIVICDRYFDSSFAYQAIGRNLFSQMLDVNKMILGGFEPDVTIFFNASREVCDARLEARSGKKDILDEETADFKDMCYEGYQIAFKANPHRMYGIDANQDMEGVRLQLCVFFEEFLKKIDSGK